MNHAYLTIIRSHVRPTGVRDVEAWMEVRDDVSDIASNEKCCPDTMDGTMLLSTDLRAGSNLETDQLIQGLHALVSSRHFQIVIRQISPMRHPPGDKAGSVSYQYSMTYTYPAFAGDILGRHGKYRLKC